MACEPDKVQASGAIYRICMPFIWNRDLIVYAHGYIAANKPVGIPEDQLEMSNGTSIIDAANALGYAFATTSYSTNGLAVKEALADLTDLVRIFKAGHPNVRRIYVMGVSEGGLITTLAAEQSPQIFSGALAACGPIGDFLGQVNYVGDFRAVFDYFFPGLVPGSPVTIPPAVINDWDNIYKTQVAPVVLAPASAISVTQLLQVAGVPYVPGEPDTIAMSIQQELWYNVMATNDATAKLGGQPFDNRSKVYAGSADDVTLNAQVARFDADPAALVEVGRYQTTGKPRIPLVTIHTTLDQTVPYWHQTLYRQKVVANNMTPRHDMIKVDRYGHCDFNQNDVMQALTLLQQRVTNPPKWRAFLPVARR